MLKAIKNIRKLNNTKLLMVSNDDGYEKSISGFKEFKQVKTLKEALELAVSSQFDIVVIDTDLNDASFL